MRNCMAMINPIHGMKSRQLPNDFCMDLKIRALQAYMSAVFFERVFKIRVSPRDAIILSNCVPTSHACDRFLKYAVLSKKKMLNERDLVVLRRKFPFFVSKLRFDQDLVSKGISPSAGWDSRRGKILTIFYYVKNKLKKDDYGLLCDLFCNCAIKKQHRSVYRKIEEYEMELRLREIESRYQAFKQSLRTKLFLKQYYSELKGLRDLFSRYSHYFRKIRGLNLSDLRKRNLEDQLNTYLYDAMEKLDTLHLSVLEANVLQDCPSTSMGTD